MKPSMAQRRQSFRFRIPWLSVATEPSQSRHPKEKPKSPPQSDTNVPVHKPSKPSVITPVESPPSPTKTQEAPKTEPQNHSPPHPTPLSSEIIPVTPTQSKPPSPKVNILSSSPKTQPQPQSPSDGAAKVPKTATAEESTHTTLSVTEHEKEKVVESEPMSQEAELKVDKPSPENLQHVGSEQEASSRPSSSPVPKTEPPSQPHSLASEHTDDDKVLKANVEESTLSSSSASHESKEAEPKMNSPLKSILKPQPENLSTQPVKIIGDEQTSTPQKAHLDIQSEQKEKLVQENTKEGKAKDTEGIEQRSTPPKSPLETLGKFLQSEEKQKVVQEITKEGKTKDSKGVEKKPTPPKSLLETQSKFLQSKDKEKVMQEATKEAKAKDTLRTIASSSAKPFHADKKQQGSQDTVERKIMFAASNPSGRDTRILSSNPATRNVSSIAPETSSDSTATSRDKTPLQKGIKDDISKFVQKLASVNPTQPIDENKKFSVITLAGDNKGATMHVGSETAKKEGSIHIHRAYKTDPDKSPEATSDGEENTEEEEEESQNDMEQREFGMAYVNSNIQSINNSLMFHGSINERDPGVQVTLPKKPDDESGPETRRTQFNIRQPENLSW